MSLAYRLPTLSVLAIALVAPHRPCGRCLPLDECPGRLSGPSMPDGWWSRRPVPGDAIFRQRMELVLRKTHHAQCDKR